MSEKIEKIVLLIAHGSRNPIGNQEPTDFYRELAKKNPSWHVELCFIELAQVLLDEGVDNVVAKASEHKITQIAVLPLILNAAGHLKMDVPAAISKAQIRHKDLGLEFILCKQIGMGEEVFTILQSEITKLNNRLSSPDPKTTSVIVLGRGSSDSAANGELAKIARWIFEANEFEIVDIAFTSVTYPRLESIVQRHCKIGMMQIIIVPVYLFGGVLIERIAEQIKRLQKQYPHISFVGGERIAFHPEIYKLMEKRVNNKEETPTDCIRCKFRVLAECEHLHDHSHGHDNNHHHHNHNHK